MNFTNRVAEFVVTHSQLVIVVIVVSSIILGTGVASVERNPSLAEYQTATSAGNTQEQLDRAFNTTTENETVAVIVVRGDDVLEKEGLLAQLELQQELQANQTVNEALTAQPTGIATVIAATGILDARGETLRADADEFNETIRPLADRLNRTRELQREYYLLNRSHEEGQIDNETYQNRSEELQRELNETMNPTDEGLSPEQRAAFRAIAKQVRDLQQQADTLERQLQAGEINQSTYLDRTAELKQQGRQLYVEELPASVYEDRYDELQQRRQELLDLRAALTGPTTDSEALPPVAEQRDQLASMNQSEIDTVIEHVLGDDADNDRPFGFMPVSYTPGSTSANATMIVVTTESNGTTLPGTATPAVIEAQTTIQDVVERNYDHANTSAFVFGNGLVNKEIDDSMIDTLSILLPLSFLYVLVVLALLYRDPVDIAIGLFGIGLVLVWMAGFMGWTGIKLSPTIVLVPILLVGLAIDYSNHVFMRYRESRLDEGVDNQGVRASMRLGLGGLFIALLWVTATTAIGFSANYFSPAPPLQDLGIVAPAGIIFAFLIFATIVPALKVEADELLEARGLDRRSEPVGTGDDLLRPVLMSGVHLAKRAPLRVVILAFLLAVAGAAGATQVEMSFQQEDFVAEEPSPWMNHLPEPLAPADYSVRENLDYVYTQFVYQNTETEFLVRGDVTNPATLARINHTEHRARDSDLVATRTTGEAAITTPLTVMRTVGASNESFNATFRAADTDNDGVPDSNVTTVYDELFDAAPELAGSVIAREDAEYRAVRMTIAGDGAASNERIAAEMRSFEEELDGEGVSVSLGGQPVVFTQVQQQILETVVNSFFYAFILIAAVLLLGYRRYHSSASLGFVTFVPILLTLAWILGTMYLLDISLHVITAMIVSITLGLGVDYTIHVSERFSEEFDGKETFAIALEQSVTGTGGALLASMLTTAGAFMILYFGFTPTLSQFGLISGLTVVYAFFASVFVLPSMLVLWYVLPRVARHWYRVHISTSQDEY